jgi:hypothetical protein
MARRSGGGDGSDWISTSCSQARKKGWWRGGGLLAGRSGGPLAEWSAAGIIVTGADAPQDAPAVQAQRHRMARPHSSLQAAVMSLLDEHQPIGEPSDCAVSCRCGVRECSPSRRSAQSSSAAAWKEHKLRRATWRTEEDAAAFDVRGCRDMGC